MTENSLAARMFTVTRCGVGILCGRVSSHIDPAGNVLSRRPVSCSEALLFYRSILQVGGAAWHLLLFYTTMLRQAPRAYVIIRAVSVCVPDPASIP